MEDDRGGVGGEGEGEEEEGGERRRTGGWGRDRVAFMCPGRRRRASRWCWAGLSPSLGWICGPVPPGRLPGPAWRLRGGGGGGNSPTHHISTTGKPGKKTTNQHRSRHSSSGSQSWLWRKCNDKKIAHDYNLNETIFCHKSEQLLTSSPSGRAGMVCCPSWAQFRYRPVSNNTSQRCGSQSLTFNVATASP